MFALTSFHLKLKIGSKDEIGFTDGYYYIINMIRFGRQIKTIVSNKILQSIIYSVKFLKLLIH
jgi:hypothetical protein